MKYQPENAKSCCYCKQDEWFTATTKTSKVVTPWLCRVVANRQCRPTIERGFSAVMPVIIFPVYLIDIRVEIVSPDTIVSVRPGAICYRCFGFDPLIPASSFVKPLS